MSCMLSALCEGIPLQRASNVQIISLSWQHHAPPPDHFCMTLRFWAWRLVAVEIGTIENWHYYYYYYHYHQSCHLRRHVRRPGPPTPAVRQSTDPPGSHCCCRSSSHQCSECLKRRWLPIITHIHALPVPEIRASSLTKINTSGGCQNTQTIKACCLSLKQSPKHTLQLKTLNRIWKYINFGIYA